jgi:hypothetical protein
MQKRIDELGLQRGDLLRVEWVDIAEDPVGSPSTAQLARRTSYGLFWGLQDSHGFSCLVTTTTVDHDVQDQNGYVIYPLGCIRDVSVIKRARRPLRPRTKKARGEAKAAAAAPPGPDPGPGVPPAS